MTEKAEEDQDITFFDDRESIAARKLSYSRVILRRSRFGLIITIVWTVLFILGVIIAACIGWYDYLQNIPPQGNLEAIFHYYNDLDCAIALSPLAYGPCWVGEGDYEGFDWYYTCQGDYLDINIAQCTSGTNCTECEPPPVSQETANTCYAYAGSNYRYICFFKE